MQAPAHEVKLPPAEPPSEGEIQRRREVFARIRKIRSQMKPLGCSVAELIDEETGEAGDGG